MMKMKTMCDVGSLTDVGLNYFSFFLIVSFISYMHTETRSKQKSRSRDTDTNRGR